MIHKKDLLILSNLRKNGRMPLTKISEATKIPVSTIFDRVKMHNGSLIKKHTTLIDFEKLGFNTRANVCIKVNKEKKDELKEHLLKHQNINSIFRINSNYDFLIETIFKNVKELDDFLESLEENFGVKHKQVYYLIEEIKREEFMANLELDKNPFDIKEV